MTAPVVTVLGWSERGARAYVNGVRVTIRRNQTRDRWLCASCGERNPPRALPPHPSPGRHPRRPRKEDPMTTTASYADALRVDRRAATYRQPVPDEVPAVLAAAVTEYRAAYEALDEIEDVLTDVDAQIAAADAADRATVRQAAQDGTLPDLPSTTPARGALVRRMQGAHAQHPDAARRALAAYTALTGAIETHRDTLAADLENRLSELSDLAAPYRRALAAIGHHTERTAELLRWVNDTAARDLAPYRGRPASALPALPAAPRDPSSGGRK